MTSSCEFTRDYVFLFFLFAVNPSRFIRSSLSLSHSLRHFYFYSTCRLIFSTLIDGIKFIRVQQLTIDNNWLISDKIKNIKNHPIYYYILFNISFDETLVRLLISILFFSSLLPIQQSTLIRSMKLIPVFPISENPFNETIKLYTLHVQVCACCVKSVKVRDDSRLSRD